MMWLLPFGLVSTLEEEAAPYSRARKNDYVPQDCDATASR